MRRLVGLIAACTLSSTALAGWVRFTDDGLTPGATSIRSGCVAPGQYERPTVPLGRSVTIGGLPEAGKCYFALNAGPQDEWTYDFTAIAGGRAAPGAVGNVVVTWAPTPAGPMFTSADIGAVGAAGSTTLANGVYTVRASGADIWGTADEFRFVYVQLTGDRTVTARLDSLVQMDSWTKAGVMFRETLAANSRFAMGLVSGANGATFSVRTTTGGQAGPNDAPDLVTRAPYWVRVRRVGNVFTAFISPNGTTWTQRGASLTVAMPATVYAGLAVTSHNDGQLATAAFSNVTTE